MTYIADADDKTLKYRAFTEFELCIACNNLLRGTDFVDEVTSITDISTVNGPTIIAFASGATPVIAVLSPMPDVPEPAIAIMNISIPVNSALPFTVTECGNPKTNLRVLYATLVPTIISPNDDSMISYFYAKADFNPILGERLIAAYKAQRVNATHFSAAFVH